MRIGALLFILWFPSALLAEKVIVRSGEHADFSRLAFEFPGPTEWKMGRVAQGYEIRLNRPDMALDISGVFQRISRDRIKSIEVSQDSTRIVLALGCECYADAFEFRPGLLVVDVKEGPAPTASEFEMAFNSDEISVPQPKAESTDTVEIEDEKSDVDQAAPVSVKGVPTVLPQFPKRPTRPRVGIFAAPASQNAGTIAAADELRRSSTRVSEMQSEILRQIGRAASQGLLEADILPLDQAEPAASAPETHTTVEAVQEPDAQSHINIHVETSIDREITAILPSEMMTKDGAECLPDELFNIAEWGNPEAIFADIAEHRSTISIEFDKVDQLALERLVKAYIYAGFGAEAQAGQTAFDVTLKDAAILRAMAQIVDSGMAQHGSVFHGQSGCDSAVALWAVLAAPELSKGMKINRKSVLGVFSSLPAHLRHHLGPGLSQKFLVIDDIETARALRNSIARAPGETRPEFHLLDARLDQIRGKHSVAQRTLETIVTEDSTVAPEALIDLLKAKLDQKSEISARLIANAESYIFEQQNTKTAATLTRLIALAQSQSGNFLAALKLLREIDDTEYFDAKENAEIWTTVMETAAEHAEEEVFLVFVFAARDYLKTQSVTHEVRQKTALRLLKAGFPEMARNILAPSRPSAADDRIILAQAAVASRDAERAIEILTQMKGDKAAMLRARAWEIKGNHSGAAQEYAAISDQENRQNALWRAGDWPQVGEFGSKAEQAGAKIMLPQNENEETGTLGVIARDQSLLEASSTARQSIDALLKEFPPLTQEGS